MPTWSAPPITCSESHDWRRLSHELTVLNPLGQVPLSKTRIRSLDSRGGPTQITMKTGYSDPFFDSLLGRIGPFTPHVFSRSELDSRSARLTCQFVRRNA